MAQTKTALGQPAMTQILSKLHDKSEDEKKVRESKWIVIGFGSYALPSYPIISFNKY